MLIRFIKRKMGLTLTELLVVVAIIVIISLALIPAITQRTENARVATARQEVKELAMAEDSCAITTGYYVPLQVLDDIKFNQYITDDALDTEQGTVYLIDPFYPYIEYDPLTGAITINSNPVQDNIVTQTKEHRIYKQWEGPYTSFVKTLLNFVGSSTDTNYDYPLDPWNVPYRFFSPIGIIGSSANNTSTDFENIKSNTSFSDGDITTWYGNYSSGNWAIVSLGRDRIFDSSPGAGDDIVHAFGLVVHESNYFVRRF